MLKKILKTLPEAGKTFHAWIKKINIAKMTTQPKANYRFNTSPIKIPMQFLIGIQDSDLYFTQNTKGPKLDQINLNNNKTITGFNFKESCKNKNKFGNGIKTDLLINEKNWEPIYKPTLLNHI